MKQAVQNEQIKLRTQTTTVTPKIGPLKNTTQSISLVVGTLLFVLGACGLLFPAFMGFHLSVIHSLIMIAAGTILFWNGYRRDHAQHAYLTCLGFGIFFGLHALAGLIFGRPGVPNIGYEKYDEAVLRIIPNFSELATMDHILNAVLAVALLAGAYDWKRKHS